MRAANFDRVARAYRWLEYASFGPLLERCRYAQLSQLTDARHALVLGDGDGRFLTRLLACNATVTIDVADSSGAMLHLLQQRVRRLGAEASCRITVQQCDALAFSPRGVYDLVVTHFFLDCLEPRQIQQLLARLAPHLAPGAGWVVSEFAVPRRPLISLLAPALIRALYLSFRLLTGLRVHTLPDYASLLAAGGFLLQRQRTFLWGVLRSELWVLGSGLWVLGSGLWTLGSGPGPAIAQAPADHP